MNIQKMMKQAQAMQSKVTEMQERLGEEEREGSAGGGAVVAVVSGKGELRKLNIDPSVIDPEDKEMLEDLIIAAFSDAKAKMDAAASEEMSQLTGSMGLPPGMKLPF